MIYTFGIYTLDTDRRELRRAGIAHPLEPHALDILTYLLRHRDRVVTKRELLEQLWPDRFVNEGILSQRLMMIRRAIGDSGSSQHCIKTLHGRGYRFAADVAIQSEVEDAVEVPNHLAHRALDGAVSTTLPKRNASLPATPALFTRPSYFVGRGAELDQLEQWWKTAQQGVRQLGFVLGEPGIGKTALVDALVTQIVNTHDVTVARGQCVDDYGTGEPYLPLLEALGRLSRGAEAERVVACLSRYAPSWLAHLPSLSVPVDTNTSTRAVRSATPAQMLRELAEALELLTVSRPLVLVLEDLHWSDRATLAWLAYIARRRDPARLLILGTYRPGDLLEHTHPLRPVITELQLNAACAELALNPLSAPAVATYLTRRCTLAFPPSLPRLIHDRTSGHPLFVVALVDELVREHLLPVPEVAPPDPDYAVTLSQLVPANLRQYIEQHFERLADEEQLLLEAGSVAGVVFTVAAVAAATSQPAETIEARYASLARQDRFICVSGTETWPDGTMTACYAFKHALYQQVVYTRASPARRAQLHGRIGARKELGYGEHAYQIAAELAVHFSRGCDAGRAVHYLYHAAENALRRSAYQEAIMHVMQGLELLASRPRNGDSAGHEVLFLTTLGLALVATKGQAHVEVEATYARARALCHQTEDTPQLLLVLIGLFSFYVVRAELSAAWEVSEELSALVKREPDAALPLVADFALGQLFLFQGEVQPARLHLDRAIALYDPDQHHALGARAGFPGDLGVFCRCFAAHTLWHLGYPDQALQHIRQALVMTQELAHPYSRALALAYAAMLHQFRREDSLAEETAATAMALCREQGFAYYLAWVTIVQGWTLLNARGQAEAGIAQMREGLTAIRETGANLRQPYYLALLAEACGRTGDYEAGLSMLDKALRDAQRHGERWHEAELYRLRGELLLLRSDDGIHALDPEVEACFQLALACARRQHAKSLELRAAISLARLWQRMGKRTAARKLLAPIYSWFTEGFDTADLRQANALLGGRRRRAGDDSAAAGRR